MLSILIPVYNFDSTEMILELNDQARSLKMDYEILVYDDNSPDIIEGYNDLNSIENIRYKYLESNLGRSAIRNKLAKDAKYPYLLFLDCDAKIPSKNFINLYINHRDEADIISGGRIYPEKEVIEPNEYLHWVYGVKRESSCNREDAKHFMTNNFLIKKEVYLSTLLDISFDGYGHEDTVFGIELRKKGYRFKIIKNPVIHIGLYDSEDFLRNTRNSIHNLSSLIGTKYREDEFFDIKLVKAYHFARKFGLKIPLKAFYSMFHKAIELNLKSRKPNLILLDIYKLGYYLSID